MKRDGFLVLSFIYLSHRIIFRTFNQKEEDDKQRHMIERMQDGQKKKSSRLKQGSVNSTMDLKSHFHWNTLYVYRR